LKKRAADGNILYILLVLLLFYGVEKYFEPIFSISINAQINDEKDHQVFNLFKLYIIIDCLLHNTIMKLVLFSRTVLLRCKYAPMGF